MRSDWSPVPVTVFAVLAVFGAVRPLAADLTAVTSVDILGPADEYPLIGSPLVASGGPAPINPGVLVGLNPQPLPPMPDPGASLDLTNPGGPVYTYPGAGLFQISWGMDAGGAVSFGPINPGDPNHPNQFTFNGTAPGGELYLVTFTLDGANPGSFVELNPQPLPPFPDPNFGFEMFTFVTPISAGDPSLTFSVSSDGTTFGFAPVPEPSPLGLAALALACLWLPLRRRRNSKHSA